MDPSRLADLEEIKRLKARYFRTLDTKQWEEFADVFTEDSSLANGPVEDGVVQGREAIVAYVKRGVSELNTVHHGHMPEIEFTGADTASGIWAMYDRLRGAALVLDGWGHYHEEYRRCADGRWRISSSRLTRLCAESPDAKLVASIWPASPA